MTVDSTTVYRDATYTSETQTGLRIALHILMAHHALAERHREGRTLLEAGIDALADVIDRWDANDATEIPELEDRATYVSRAKFHPVAEAARHCADEYERFAFISDKHVDALTDALEAAK